ncbi:uncharacterized protein LOC119739652 [Patiria miniata]|uniref:Transmembrane protein n=1 Tax=Patiria miniata TaxID=46514 RepID=A0A914B527_PATMI|nr:uncharacterized protein LOC119739652 [Patiria miniata]
MAHHQVYFIREMSGIVLLFIAVSLGCVWCVDGAATTDAGTTPSLYTTIEADARTDDLPQSDGGTTPNFKDSATSTTSGNTTIVSTSSAAPTEVSPDRYGQIHWLLFTGWQMPLVMVGVEIIAYCVTIFIVFGFGQKRSRIKRFGHFSWKRPNPFVGQDDLASRASTLDSRLKVRKPSVRGHRP